MAKNPSEQAFQLCILGDEENLDAFARRLAAASGTCIAFVGMREKAIASSAEQLSVLTKALHASKAYIATKNSTIAKHARAKGIRVIDRTTDLKEMLAKHPQMHEALRVFSPHVWRQQLKSQLQRMGLVSMPRLRIYSLVALSGALFFFVVFRLLPSSDVIVKARQETVTQTVNVFLAESGAQLPATRVRQLPLRTLEVRDTRSLTFDQISKQFVGHSAVVDLKISNASSDQFSLRKGTRFQNQAGMVFRTLGPVIIPAKSSAIIRAKADDIDAFGQIVGQRGNVPAGIEWFVPALDEAQRKTISAKNPQAASGGTTAYRTVLSAQDLEIARKRLEQELLAGAKKLVNEQIDEANSQDPSLGVHLLQYAELTKLTYTGFIIPNQFIGQEVTSVPIEGGIEYEAHAYDAKSILEFLRKELESHVREGKRLLDETLSDESLVVHVIDYADDLSWIKLTVDLSATERYVLDPLTPDGALFAKRVRDDIVGLTVDEALRIVRNMPEVETAEISMWPPWSRRLPHIPAHISVSEAE